MSGTGRHRFIDIYIYMNTTSKKVLLHPIGESENMWKLSQTHAAFVAMPQLVQEAYSQQYSHHQSFHPTESVRAPATTPAVTASRACWSGGQWGTYDIILIMILSLMSLNATEGGMSSMIQHACLVSLEPKDTWMKLHKKRSMDKID